MNLKIKTNRLSVVLLASVLAVGILLLIVSALMLVGSASSAQPGPGPGTTITQQANPDPATVGQPLTFTITDTNLRPYELPGMSVRNFLPEGVNFVSATSTHGSCVLASKEALGIPQSPSTPRGESSDVVECDLGTLPAGATATMDLVVIPTAAGTITNQAVDYGEKTAEATVTVNEAQPPLSIALSASPNLAPSGQPLTYTITETNNQASTFPEVAVRDLLPDDVTFVSATPSQGECDYAPSVNNVFCELGDISPRGTATVDIVVTPTRTGTIANTAYDILNNRAGVSVSVR